MRTWYVGLEMLDAQRVLAQHREIHTVIGSLLSVKRGYQNHPVVRLYNGAHLACLLDYHEMTVREFLARGWRGHRTPLSEEILRIAQELRTAETCKNWSQHVSFHVSHDALQPAQGWHNDMHDLTKRWVREGKTPKHPDVSEWVSWHAKTCHETCQALAKQLLAG